MPFIKAIASTTSPNQNALFVSCDHMLYVHDAPTQFTLPQAHSVMSTLPSGLSPRAASHVKFCYFPEPSCNVISLKYMII